MKLLELNYEMLLGATARKQSIIAAQIGITQPALSYQLNKKRPMTLNRLNQICQVLNRDITDFLIEVNKDMSSYNYENH